MEFPYASNICEPDFAKLPDGLVPAVVQDAQTRRVLMLGYMNADALAETRASGRVTFFSRSRQRLWTKGETSGNFLLLRGLRLDCDGDALLVLAQPHGPVCHNGTDTCWGETNDAANFLGRLEGIIESRRNFAPEDSYTARLLGRDIAKIAQKVGEEAVETVIEAMRDDRGRLLEESADLLFHLLVLWAAKGIALSEVEAVLEERNKRKQ